MEHSCLMQVLTYTFFMKEASTYTFLLKEVSTYTFLMRETATYTFFEKSAFLLKMYADLKGATYTFFIKIVSLLKFQLITFVIRLEILAEKRITRKMYRSQPRLVRAAALVGGGLMSQDDHGKVSAIGNGQIYR